MDNRAHRGRHWRRAGPLAALAGVLGVAAYLYAPFLVASAAVPVTFDDADLNHDGAVSFTEADYIASSGRRTFFRAGRTCTEFFAYKDGLSLKTICK